MPNTDTALAAVMYAPGVAIPDNMKRVAAILYGSSDTIPDHLLKLALANRGAMLATGQVIQYSSELDDGFYKKGLVKAYSVLTVGQYAGTKNIDLAHYVGTDIAFTRGSPDTITSTVLDFTTLFVAADVIVISGATNSPNNVARTIAAAGVAANALTLTESLSQTVEAAGASVTIAKREAHSNACVLDLNTGLMWSRIVSDKMGTSSNGNMPWTGQVYDIFQYAAAANTASLGGYTDWRIPNINELLGIIDWSTSPRAPNSTAWPTFPAVSGPWSSTVDAVTDTKRLYLLLNVAKVIDAAATTGSTVALLVRGG